MGGRKRAQKGNGSEPKGGSRGIWGMVAPRWSLPREEKKPVRRAKNWGAADGEKLPPPRGKGGPVIKTNTEGRRHWGGTETRTEREAKERVLHGVTQFARAGGQAGGTPSPKVPLSCRRGCREDQRISNSWVTSTSLS